MTVSNLVDAWRFQHPDLQELTSSNSSSRIDYVLVSSRLFQKNERKQVLENPHLKVNGLQHLQARNPSAADPTILATAKAQLKERLAEQNYHALKHKFTSNLENTERCFKFFFWPPQVLYKTPISVDLAEDLDSTCAELLSFWSRIYCSPLKKFGHGQFKSESINLTRFFQNTTARLAPKNQAYLDSPFTVIKFYWALTHTTIGKTPGQDGLPVSILHDGLTSRESNILGGLCCSI
ncbi:Endonuclease/exonuclease/phosphatase [Plasmopara halstedii]|uniref:Endonuclease/exonuclease/phosphatase n=1 Tax=Plasmopara halstedii TaxID=4781 RepID=A0A0N7L568_PLAHL|nr:Endonuclease/exonuclease/phosphatase [Plasmopara halstedii]CEG40635.1 Endonuclease/exonuclease/phosphatase [Plasmopara halstedii]|eukprot:XP_024577004.1 Endonuclease/exonuclease/phosphatase [Plasmopara halstedii]